MTEKTNFVQSITTVDMDTAAVLRYYEAINPERDSE